MAKMIEPYNSGYIAISEVMNSTIEELALIMQQKRSDQVYIESSYIGSDLANRAKKAAKIAGKGIGFASIRKMTDWRLVPRKKRH